MRKSKRARSKKQEKAGNVTVEEVHRGTKKDE